MIVALISLGDQHDDIVETRASGYGTEKLVEVDETRVQTVSQVLDIVKKANALGEYVGIFLDDEPYGIMSAGEFSSYEKKWEVRIRRTTIQFVDLIVDGATESDGTTKALNDAEFNTNDYDWEDDEVDYDMDTIERNWD
jgi:hypothetical protein